MPTIAESLLTNLSVAYNLEETTATAARVDSSGNGLTLLCEGSPVRVAGKLGFASQFNGVNQAAHRVSAPALRATSAFFTITAWVKITTPNTNINTVVAKRGDAQIEYELFYDSVAERLRFRASVDGLVLKMVETVMGVDDWHFVTAVIDTDNDLLTLRVDDGAVITGAGPASVYDGGKDFAIGAAWSGVSGSNFLRGELDAIAIWKRALSEDEWNYLWRGGRGRQFPWESLAGAKNAILLRGAGSSRGALDDGGGSLEATEFWTQRESAADNLWMAVTWVNELDLFVAVAESGVGNRVMTSPDGVLWTVQETPLDNVEWWSVTYGAGLAGGLLVAVARGFDAGPKVMTSPDAETWTARTSPNEDSRWRDVCWSEELGLFVAVGHAARFMRSADGINWTAGLLPVATNHDFISVCWGNGLFVAVANYGPDYQRVCTSPDGVTWTARTVPAKNAWRGVTFGDGLFVAVANPSYDHEAPGQLVMTSPDGINWTLRNCDDQWWEDICWGNGLFVAVSSYQAAGGQRAMSSPDGVNWTLEDTPALAWRNPAYSPKLGRFCAVAFSGSGNRVMTRGGSDAAAQTSVNLLKQQVFDVDPLALAAEVSPLFLQGFAS